MFFKCLRGKLDWNNVHHYGLTLIAVKVVVEFQNPYGLNGQFGTWTNTRVLVCFSLMLDTNKYERRTHLYFIAITNELYERGSGEARTEPCTIRCTKAMGLIPTLMCSLCLCLYHPICCDMENVSPFKTLNSYVCKVSLYLCVATSLSCALRVFRACL